MTPIALLVLTVGVLVVLAVAGVALALDARRRTGPVAAPSAATHQPWPSRPAARPPAPDAHRQTEPIGTVEAQRDPATVATPAGQPADDPPGHTGTAEPAPPTADTRSTPGRPGDGPRTDGGR